MATANPLEDEISCSVCFDIFKEPHILRECFHTFCHECIKKLEQRGSVQCPECRVITESRHIKKDFKTQRLIDVYNNQNETSKGKPLKRKCGMCKKSNEVKSHCSECDHYMCADCEEIHKSMKVARDHNVKQLKEIIKGYESILKKDVDDLEKQMRRTNERSSKFSKGIDRLEAARKKQLTDLKLFTENAKKELDENEAHLAKVINEANDNLIKQLTGGQGICTETKAEIQNKIDFINQMIKAQDIDTLSDTTSSVDKATKADIEKIKASLDKTVMCMDSPVTVEKGKDWDAKSCVNVLIDSANVQSKHVKKEQEHKNLDFHKWKYKLDKNQAIDYIPQKLCVTKNELWATGGDALYIYTKDCKLTKKITHQQITNICGITQCPVGNLIVACGNNKGLHQLDSTGKYLKQIAEGSYSDTYHYKEFLYTLETKSSKVIVFKSFDNHWSKIKKFNGQYDSCSSSDKLIVNEAGIWISVNSKHHIYHFNMEDGILQKQINIHLSQMSYPKVCNVDSAGQLLVADFGDYCLQFRDKGGKWHVLETIKLDGRPMHAVVQDNCLWVVTFNDNKIMKFTFDKQHIK